MKNRKRKPKKITILNAKNDAMRAALQQLGFRGLKAGVTYSVTVAAEPTRKEPVITARILNPRQQLSA